MCTGIKLQIGNPLTGETKQFVHGRTLEFGVEVDTDIVYIPAGESFQCKMGNGFKTVGMSYKSDYAILAAWAKSMGSLVQFEDINCFDGINEEGLALGVFFFPSYAQYQILPEESTESTASEEDISKGMGPQDFPRWILSKFTDVDQVKKAIANKEVVVFRSIPNDEVGKPLSFDPLTVHYIVYDRTGKSIVIEPVDGKLIVHDNPLGIITNSPTFDWHMTNLSNYIALDPRNVPSIEIAGETFSQLGQGTGMLGMPGDFTPPARFVRATVFSQTAIPSTTIEEGIEQVFHILNNFDIPVGVARAGHETDYTMFTSARDPHNLRYYWKTYEDQTIRMVDLKKLMATGEKNVKTLSTESEQPIVDMTNDLKG